MSDDKHVRRNGDDYGDAFVAYLPYGQAWPRDLGSTLDRACRGLAYYWGSVDDRAADLLETESDPRATSELLLDWERNWELPDPCETFPPTTEPARRDDLLFKMTLLGRQDRQFFIDMAARQGQTVTIREYAPYMCGVSRVGDTRMASLTDDTAHFRWQLGPPEMRYYWQVDLENVLTGVECMFERYKPAQTDVVFTYRSVLDRSAGLYPWLMA